MFVIRKKLSATEGANPNQRYDPDENTIETTYDGGLTWTPTPQQDPRSSLAFMNPNAAPECDAGQGYSNFIRSFIDGTYTAFNIVGITSWALNIAVYAGFALNPFVGLALLIAEGVVGIGAITLADAFDEDTYDQLRCIFYCRVDADGHIPDQATFDLIGLDIQEQISDGNVNIVMALMFNLYGFVGFTNAAIALAEASDCDECECGWCFQWVGTELTDWTILTFGGFTGQLGHDTSDGIESNPIYAPDLTVTVGAGASIAAPEFNLKTVEIVYDYTAGNFASDPPGRRMTIAGFLAGVLVFSTPYQPVDSNGVDKVFTWSGNEQIDSFQFRCDSATYPSGSSGDGLVIVKSVEMSGSGDNQFGEDNC